MLDVVYAWLALLFIFLAGALFAEADVRFGYVLIPLLSGIFYLFGWLPEIFMVSVFPLVVGLGIIMFIREQYKVKFNVYGSTGSLLWKAMFFMMFLQVAIVFVNGLAMFNHEAMLVAQNSTINTYSITSAQAVYGNYSQMNAFDVVALSMIPTMIWNLTIGMLFTVVTLFPNLVNVFHLDPAIALVISMWFYIMIGLELFVLLYKPSRAPE